MNTDRGGTIVPIEPGFIERASAGLRFAVTGDASVWDGWFGPSAPLPPIAPKEVEGRQFDYPFGANLLSRPRANEQITFATLRGLADSYDLLRLVIETRKDQLEKMEWVIRCKDGKGNEKRAQELTEFFYFPDKINTWSQWLRALLEDMLVIDAATAYNRVNRGGTPWAIELIDGATIQRLIGEDGRTPIEGPAYQQILKGIKAVDYTRDELLYLPKNVRTNRLYGFSPVEQVIMTTNIAIRRQINQLQYYTEGNTPDLIIGLPKEWQPSAVKQFQEWWNSMINSADQSERRKTRFVPDGLKVIDTKDRVLKDEYDEWLARVICYAFSISPQPFVKETNRATAETAMKQALSEGLMPLMKYTQSFMDSILFRFFKETDYEFAWVEEQAIDPLVQAQIHEIQIRAGLRTVEEIREADLKLENIEAEAPEVDENGNPIEVPAAPGAPITGATAVQDTALNGAQIASLLAVTAAVADGSLPQDSAIAVLLEAFPQIDEERAKAIITPIKVKEPEPVPAPFANQAPFPGKQKLPQAMDEGVSPKSKKPTEGMEPGTKEKVAKAKNLISMDREFVLKIEKQLRAAWKKWLRSQVNPIASQITESLGKVAKTSDEDKVAAVLKSLGFKNPAVIRDTTEKMLKAVYADAGYEALQKLAKDSAEYEKMLSVVNERAADWAKTEAAKRIEDITNSTRDMLKTSVEQAIRDGLSTQELADLLADDRAFSDDRANTIARTELAFANVNGTVDGYRESGVVKGLEWLVSPDDTCDDCMEMVGKEGSLENGFDGDFPPLHPNCRCDVVPVMDEEPEKVQLPQIIKLDTTELSEALASNVVSNQNILDSLKAMMAATAAAKPKEVQFQYDAEGRIIGGALK